jgi:hypothetical protein
MARKPESEFRKRLQGTAYRTLKSENCRKAIETAVVSFSEHSGDGGAWESLCAIRDHVNALIGAYQDLELADRQQMLSKVESGELRGKSALEALRDQDQRAYPMSAIHAEADRQGIPE